MKMNNIGDNMFYDFPLSTEIIEQGDIFLNIPRIEIDFNEIPILGEGNTLQNITWEEIVVNKQDVSGVLGITPVPAIVVTQKCDAQRREYITLCEIVELSNTSKTFEQFDERPLKNIAKELIKHNRDMHGIFYLPPSKNIGFTNRMAVNFLNTIRLKREDLERFKSNRKGRLNNIANEHFREKLSHFFHRYAWNEWYILNKQEVSMLDDYPQLNPIYDWQK